MKKAIRCRFKHMGKKGEKRPTSSNYLITCVTCSCFAAFFYVKVVHTHKYAQRENCAANYFSQRAWPY